MDDEKFNLVNEEEVESKSYEELLKLEEDLMHNSPLPRKYILHI